MTTMMLILLLLLDILWFVIQAKLAIAKGAKAVIVDVRDNEAAARKVSGQLLINFR